MTSDLNFNSIEWTTRIKAGIAVKAGIQQKDDSDGQDQVAAVELIRSDWALEVASTGFS